MLTNLEGDVMEYRVIDALALCYFQQGILLYEQRMQENDGYHVSYSLVELVGKCTEVTMDKNKLSNSDAQVLI